jgi:hypothetical protein
MTRLLRYCARPIFASERLLWAQPAERRGQGRAGLLKKGSVCLLDVGDDFLDVEDVVAGHFLQRVQPLDPTIPLGPAHPPTPPETWRLGPMKGPNSPRF